MDYNILWFVLIVILFTGFFFLEGFDYGVGTLLTLISDKESDRSQLIRTIGPVWDGNEVWMITAGGASSAIIARMKYGSAAGRTPLLSAALFLHFSGALRSRI